MGDWVRFAHANDFAGAKPKCLTQNVNGHDILVIAKGDGSYYAIDAICRHAYGQLEQGDIVGYEIECPLHGSTFDIRTGQCLLPPATESLRTYAIKVVDNEVHVELPAD